MGKWEKKSLSGTPLFAAANSGRGFISFYEDVFGAKDIEKRYLIKGGPGTGKSHLLRCVAEYAEQKGKKVAYYRCSSDPDSLDGIVIDKRIAVVDSTPPHSIEPILAGVRDEIVNLGDFWDVAALAARKEEIAVLNEKKSSCYRSAYRFLAACDDLYAVNRSIVLPYVKHDKLEAVVARRLGRIPRGSGFSLLPGLSDAVGMKGSVHLDSYEQRAKKLHVIEDFHETGALFLRALLTGGMHRDCPMRVSYHPIHVGEPDAVYFCDSGDCFVIAKGETPDGKELSRINMKRFVDVDALRVDRVRLRMNARMYDALLGSAEEALHDAGKHHFELEQIYASCMDFEAQNGFVKAFCERIL